MNANTLNEHDANQGAQSSGEFLGMTGNSGWYLLGSAGATILMVVFLWGVLGVSLLLCLFVGVVLCLGSVVYVFALKNNRPQHYDTDFFESCLVESGLLAFRFSPRTKRVGSPFLGLEFTADTPAVLADPSRRRAAPKTAPAKSRRSEVPPEPAAAVKAETKREKHISRAEYELLREKFERANEALEEALEGEEL